MTRMYPSIHFASFQQTGTVTYADAIVSISLIGGHFQKKVYIPSKYNENCKLRLFLVLANSDQASKIVTISKLHQ